MKSVLLVVLSVVCIIEATPKHSDHPSGSGGGSSKYVTHDKHAIEELKTKLNNAKTYINKGKHNKQLKDGAVSHATALVAALGHEDKECEARWEAGHSLVKLAWEDADPHNAAVEAGVRSIEPVLKLAASRHQEFVLVHADVEKYLRKEEVKIVNLRRGTGNAANLCKNQKYRGCC